MSPWADFRMEIPLQFNVVAKTCREEHKKTSKYQGIHNKHLLYTNGKRSSDSAWEGAN